MTNTPLTDIEVHELSAYSDADLLRIEDQAYRTRMVVEANNLAASNGSWPFRNHLMSLHHEATRLLAERGVVSMKGAQNDE